MKIRIPIVSTLIHYYQVFRPYIGYKLFVFIGITLIAGLTEGLGITLFLPFFTQTNVAEASPDAMSGFIHGLFNVFSLPMSPKAILAFITLTFVFKGVVTYVQTMYQAWLSARLARDMRHHIITIASDMDYRYYTSRNTGFFTNLITVEVNRAVDFFNRYSMVLSYIVTLIALLVMSLFLNWQFTVFAIVAGGVVLYMLKYFSRLSAGYSRETSRENAILQALLIQTVQAFKYLKSTTGFQRLFGKLSTSVNTVADLEFKVGRASSVVHSFSEPIILFALIAVLYYQVVVLGSSVAPILVAIMLFYRMLMAVTYFQKQWQNVCAMMGGIDMVVSISREMEQNEEIRGTATVPALEKEIEFRNVTFAYNDKPVLRNVNIHIPKNTTVALVGESGSGKSTIVDLLTGLLRPQQGEVLVDGIPLHESDVREYRKRIGYVTQECIVFDDSVANNISMWGCDPADGECRTNIEDAARRAYCDDYIREMSGGYDALIGDRGVMLSGGQRQRLAIARELFKNPRLLILDEATSALDSESEQFIQRSIDELKGTMTVVIIAHRLSTIKNADYIYVLAHGEVLEHGSFAELSAKEGRFRKMVELQNVV